MTRAPLTLSHKTLDYTSTFAFFGRIKLLRNHLRARTLVCFRSCCSKGRIDCMRMSRIPTFMYRTLRRPGSATFVFACITSLHPRTVRDYCSRHLGRNGMR
ncbi:unnamed protein product [Mycena citricolor]|uniref:Uncharacterized protein n=1 Tax=Mycena citricolor TaxID=2018698 RepID=A0AAD2H6I5_9AGAR|nr:unnamed protein product [Mycena citricolor]